MLTLSLDSVSLPSLPPHSSSHLGLQLSTMNPSVSSHYNATPRGRGTARLQGQARRVGHGHCL